MLNLIYCDESRHTQDRFMAIGGVVVCADSLAVVQHEFALLRKRQKFTVAEMKWNKVSKSWLPKYKSFVNLFFTLAACDALHFSVLVVDMHRVNHRKYNQGDKELGFYKFYYQLLLNCFGRHYCPVPLKDRFIVYPDKRTTKYPVAELKDILNSGMKKNFDNWLNPFLSVEPQDSKNHDLLQVVDVLIGAIGYQKNDLHMAKGCCPAKKELAEHIARTAGLRSLKWGTSMKATRFKIWNFRLRD